MPDEAKDPIRRIMDELLLKPADGRYGVLHFFKGVVQQCEARSLTFLPETAFEYWWNLIRIGVLVPMGSIEDGRINWPQLPQFDVFVLTQRGRALLERGDNSPHDPVRYLDALRRRVTNPDEIALGYLDEAVGTWRDGHYRASAVMLGCACEALVLILADRIAGSGLPSVSGRVENAMKAKPVHISQVFEIIRKGLPDLKDRLPGDLQDALERRITAIFEHARRLRNRSGHPTGEQVSAQEAEAGLLLFPGFYEFIDRLCRALPSRA